MTTPPTTECILWTGSIRKDGYGRRALHRNVMTAHRAAWIEAHGPIPEGLYVRHLCHTRACVRLDHLRLGGATENAQDNRDAGLPVNGWAARDACCHGHPFTPENTRLRVRGGSTERVCRTCDRLRGSGAKRRTRAEVYGGSPG